LDKVLHLFDFRKPALIFHRHKAHQPDKTSHVPPIPPQECKAEGADLCIDFHQVCFHFPCIFTSQKGHALQQEPQRLLNEI
jgi:hypothetical protein